MNEFDTIMKASGMADIMAAVESSKSPAVDAGDALHRLAHNQQTARRMARLGLGQTGTNIDKEQQPEREGEK